MNTPSFADDRDLERYRPRLFGIAFRMIGDVQDAEDLVQEAMLRWQNAERASVTRARGLARRRHHPPRHRPPAKSQDPARDVPRALAARVAEERLSPHTGPSWPPTCRWRSSCCWSGSRRGARGVPPPRRLRCEPESPAPWERAWPRPGGRAPSGSGRIARGSRRPEREGAGSSAVPDGDPGQRRGAACAVQRGHGLDQRWRREGQRRGPRAARRGACRADAGGKSRRSSARRSRIVWPTSNGEPAVLEYRSGELFAATFCDTDGERVSAMYRVLNPEKLTHVA